MKVSVVVPSFNYAQYIDACLQSIQSQTYSNFEVLIADGGSTDGSLEIIEKFCQADARFRLVSREDKGQPDAVNKTLKLADGDIQCFLNADDVYLSQEVFAVIVKAFTAYRDVSIISSAGYYIDADGKYIKPVRLRYHPLDNIGWMKYRVACLQPATFWRKYVFENVSFKIDFHYSFDSVFFYEAYIGYSWLEIADVTAGYRLHGQNKSMWVKSARIRELADFEVVKFGKNSLRAFYLRGIAWMVSLFERLGKLGLYCSKGLYFLVNGLAYLTCYRLPSI